MSILRDDNYNRASRRCTTLNIASFVVSLGVFLPGKQPAVTCLVVLMPLLALMLVKRSGGVVTLDNSRQSKRLTVGAAYSTPMLLLGAHAFFGWHVLEWDNLWLPGGSIYAASVGLTLWLGWGLMKNLVTAIGCPLYCALFAYGAAINLNGALDNSMPEKYHAVVLKKTISHGKHISYRLTLTPWRNEPEQSSEVSQAIYNRQALGSTVTIDVWRGWLGIPYAHLE